MRRRTIPEQVIFATTVLFLGAALGGTKACQEDYSVASQAKVTPLASATPTDDGSGDVITNTPTSTPTSTGSPSTSGTNTPTPTSTPTGTVAAGAAFLRSLSTLQGSESAASAPHKNSAATGGGQGPGADGNWLGKAFAGEDGAGSHSPADSDADGFADWLEDELESDARDARSAPKMSSGELMERLSQVDSDIDGMTNAEEVERGTDPAVADSDGDGASDGAELASGADPKDATSRPVDADGDGLSNAYEQQAGSDARLADTDGDGARDDTELAVGSDPKLSDTDGDGILDGKEIDVGSDPLKADQF